MKECRITAKNPEIDITIPMGDGPAYSTGGLGGWSTVQRQDNISVTDWAGQEPLTQDVPLLLDGFAEHLSMEREWNTVKKLGRDPNGDERKPPVFKVFGPVEYPGKSWVLPEGGIEPNPASFLKRDDGELLRVEFTLHLLEYIRPDTLGQKRRRRTGISQNVALTYTTRKGDTLISIAAEVLGNWQRWRDIGALNGISDPHRELPAKRVLRLP